MFHFASDVLSGSCLDRFCPNLESFMNPFRRYADSGDMLVLRAAGKVHRDLQVPVQLDFLFQTLPENKDQVDSTAVLFPLKSH